MWLLPVAAAWHKAAIHPLQLGSLSQGLRRGNLGISKQHNSGWTAAPSMQCGADPGRSGFRAQSADAGWPSGTV